MLINASCEQPVDWISAFETAHSFTALTNEISPSLFLLPKNHDGENLSLRPSHVKRVSFAARPPVERLVVQIVDFHADVAANVKLERVQGPELFQLRLFDHCLRCALALAGPRRS